MKRQDTVLLFVLSVIGGILFLSILLLVIQFTNFQKAYSRELEEETKRNNFYLVRLFRDLLESDQLDKMQKMLSSGSHGPNPMIVKIIAPGRGVVLQTQGVPAYLAEHISEPEIRDMFKANHEENVLIKFDRSLGAFMVYHSVRFQARGQDYVLVMASRCSGMTMLMRQTRLGILGLSFLGILAALVLVMYFTCRIYAPLNSLFASMSKIASGELEYPVYVPKKGLIRETALCLQSLTEQLKKQILSLRDGAHEREAILNALTEAVLLVDATYRVRQWNRTAELLFFGVCSGKKHSASFPENADSPDSPDSSDSSDSSFPVCPEELRDFIRQAEEHASGSGEITFRRGEQTFQLLVHTVSFTRENGRYYLISATDLSDIRKLESYRSDFIAAISHEMKTPLTGIIGAVDAIHNGALDNSDYRARCIETLTLQSERLHTLLQNFLTLTSLETMSRMSSEDSFLPLQSSAVLRSTVEVSRHAAQNAKMELRIGRCDSVEFSGDALLLQQALNNLISNAILHSGAKNITVSAVRDGEKIDFCVEDDGCGIAPEHQARIFNRFYRVPSGKRKGSGSGIGLAIVRQIAIYHRGTVSLHSEPGGGSGFHLVLPLSQ